MRDRLSGRRGAQGLRTLYVARRRDRTDSLFIAEYSEAQRANRGGGVDDEDIEVLELPFVRALEMVASGEIQDGKAVILLQYLQNSGLMSRDL